MENRLWGWAAMLGISVVTGDCQEMAFWTCVRVIKANKGFQITVNSSEQDPLWAFRYRELRSLCPD